MSSSTPAYPAAYAIFKIAFPSQRPCFFTTSIPLTFIPALTRMKVGSHIIPTAVVPLQAELLKRIRESIWALSRCDTVALKVNVPGQSGGNKVWQVQTAASGLIMGVMTVIRFFFLNAAKAFSYSLHMVVMNEGLPTSFTGAGIKDCALISWYPAGFNCWRSSV